MLSADIRSRHFWLTLERLLAHSGDGARGIVWAHNTHVGDSRGTNGRFVGELSLGQLARRALGRNEVFILGFGAGVGEVLAARRWGGPCEILPIPAQRRDSLEAAMLAGGEQERLWFFRAGELTTRSMTRWIAHRAIGSTFDPMREPSDNYVPTQAPVRYDAFMFLPQTRPLQALDWPSGEARCGRGQRKIFFRQSPITPCGILEIGPCGLEKRCRQRKTEKQANQPQRHELHTRAAVAGKPGTKEIRRNLDRDAR
jgi:hypothetical protein